jgi:hypothetical protein
MKRFAWLPVSLCLVCFACPAVLLSAPSMARATGEPSSTPDEEVWVTDGTVRAIAIAPDGTTYIGGDFFYVGPRTGHGVALDATTGVHDPSFPLVDGGVVSAAVPDGSGGYYIGGGFTEVGGLTRNHIAHILSDGTVDAAFDPDADGTVSALAVSGSTVYAGGWFTTIGGQTRNHIAALDAGSGVAIAWNPDADDGVIALAVSGSTVYLGGLFTSVGGEERSCIAAVDATSGLVRAWDPHVDRAHPGVLTLAVSGSTVYAGGGFISAGGQTRNYVAALDPDSGAATSWNPNANGTVSALAVSGSTV